MSSGSGVMSKQRAKIPHHVLLGKGGLPGEVAQLRAGVEAENRTLAGMVVFEATNPATADVDAFKLAAASVTSAVVWGAANLDGVVGDGTLDVARPVTITTAGATPADAPATATVYGLDIKGRAISETIAVPQTATTGAGAKCFARITKITMPAGQGTGALISFGFDALLGLPQPVRARAGLSEIQREIVDAAVVTTGALTSAVTNPPYGGYVPAAAPNGAHDYALYYEGDFR